MLFSFALGATFALQQHNSRERITRGTAARRMGSPAGGRSQSTSYLQLARVKEVVGPVWPLFDVRGAGGGGGRQRVVVVPQ